MASYVESSLTSGERLLYSGRISLWSQIGYLLLGLVTLPLFGVGLIFFGLAAIAYYSTEMAVTNKRVIAKFGLISRSTVEIALSKIESIQVNQSILGRLFNYGSIVVSGAGNPQAPVPGISNPMDFRRACLDAQESAGKPASFG